MSEHVLFISWVAIYLAVITRLSWCHNMEVPTGKLDIDYIDRIVIL